MHKLLDRVVTKDGVVIHDKCVGSGFIGLTNLVYI